MPTNTGQQRREILQYTAIDECKRFVYREMYYGHSTYSSADFLGKPVLAFAFPIREIQTDNGSEFMDALKAKHCDKSLFEQALENMNIIYHRVSIEKTKSGFTRR